MQDIFVSYYTLDSIIDSYAILNNEEREKQILGRLYAKNCNILIGMINNLLESIQRLIFLKVGLSKEKDKALEWRLNFLIARCQAILEDSKQKKIKEQSTSCRIIYLSRDIKKLKKNIEFIDKTKLNLLQIYLILDTCKKELVGTKESKSFYSELNFRHNPGIR